MMRHVSRIFATADVTRPLCERASCRAFSAFEIAWSVHSRQSTRAIRRIFPTLAISDADLVNAIGSEASKAGLEIDFDVITSSHGAKRKALERWDDEGGAIGGSPPFEGTQGKAATDVDDRQKPD
jgi:hypothetical protein